MNVASIAAVAALYALLVALHVRVAGETDARPGPVSDLDGLIYMPESRLRCGVMGTVEGGITGQAVELGGPVAGQAVLVTGQALPGCFVEPLPAFTRVGLVSSGLIFAVA